jgi:hypothetical protein
MSRQKSFHDQLNSVPDSLWNPARIRTISLRVPRCGISACLACEVPKVCYACELRRCAKASR